MSPDILLAELHRHWDLQAKHLTLYQDFQQRYFPDPEQVSYEQSFRHLPLLRGVLFETENVAWCEYALQLHETALPTENTTKR